MKNIQRTMFAALLFAASTALASGGVAFLSNLKGEVRVDGARAALLAELAPGQKLVLAGEAQAAVMYIATGKEFVLQGPGEYHVQAADVAAAKGTAPAARSTEWRASNKVLAQVANTSSASVRMRSVAPPKADTSAKLLFPTEGNVATLQPTFKWRSEGAAEFVLTVAGQDKPVHQAKVTSTSYRMPARLKPETEYGWSVKVAGNAIGEGRFRTLGRDAIQAVDKRRPAEKAEFSDKVLFTLMLQEMGARQEAQESWARLAQEREDLPELSAFAK